MMYPTKLFMKTGFWEETILVRILSTVECGLSVVNSVIEENNERR